jgi:hypothetical protein
MGFCRPDGKNLQSNIPSETVKNKLIAQKFLNAKFYSCPQKKPISRLEKNGALIA